MERRISSTRQFPVSNHILKGGYFNMMNQVKFQWIKKFAAVISIISIIMPSPAYSSREVRTANSPVVLNELTGDLLAAGIGRAELRSIPRNLEGQIFHVSANQVKGTSPLWTVSKIGRA